MPFHAQLLHKLRTIRIRTLIKTRKWQIAEQMASTPALKMSLYVDLVAEQLYLQANEVYHKHMLGGHVAPVTLEQMKEQQDKERDMYLLLPAHIHSQICMVNDLISLQRAAIALLPPPSARTSDASSSSSSQKPFFIGVDTEWRAVVTHKKQTATSGASVLQVTIQIYRYLTYMLVDMYIYIVWVTS
jgi:hypothetical protein